MAAKEKYQFYLNLGFLGFTVFLYSLDIAKGNENIDKSKNLKNMQIHIAHKDLKSIHELTDDAVNDLIENKSD